MQRVRVGMTGLALVLVIIGAGSVIVTSANRDQPVSAIGASNAQVVANLTDGNVTTIDGIDEPLATLGVAPSTSDTLNSGAAARK